MNNSYLDTSLSIVNQEKNKLKNFPIKNEIFELQNFRLLKPPRTLRTPPRTMRATPNPCNVIHPRDNFLPGTGTASIPSMSEDQFSSASLPLSPTNNNHTT